MNLENVSDEDLAAELARRREAKETERQRKRQAKKDKVGALVDELKKLLDLQEYLYLSAYECAPEIADVLEGLRETSHVRED